jgi:hypothetical protein
VRTIRHLKFPYPARAIAHDHFAFASTTLFIVHQTKVDLADDPFFPASYDQAQVEIHRFIQKPRSSAVLAFAGPTVEEVSGDERLFRVAPTLGRLGTAVPECSCRAIFSISIRNGV